MNTTAGLGGSIPQLNRGADTPGYKPLYHSLPEVALIIDKTLKAGYGVLRAGTVAAVAGNYLVPYTQDDHDNADVTRAYLVTDGANGANVCYVTQTDSYKFAVGDTIMLVRDNAGAPDYHDGGAITAIDRTTESFRAKITFTTVFGAATFTTANKANCYVKAGTNAKGSKAVYVIDQDIDTGTGEDAKGALTSVCVSNAVLYKNNMTNLDSSAVTDLGGVVDGRFFILK